MLNTILASASTGNLQQFIQLKGVQSLLRWVAAIESAFCSKVRRIKRVPKRRRLLNSICAGTQNGIQRGEPGENQSCRNIGRIVRAYFRFWYFSMRGHVFLQTGFSVLCPRGANRSHGWSMSSGSGRVAVTAAIFGLLLLIAGSLGLSAAT